jgi:hypothetical protein
MATTQPAHRRTDERQRSDIREINPSEMGHDVIEYLREYARENPESAALWCFGVGFILGWKLKLW